MCLVNFKYKLSSKRFTSVKTMQLKKYIQIMVILFVYGFYNYN